jgi:hypothetical protein
MKKFSRIRKIHPAWFLFAVVLFLLWDMPFLLPLKIFVVFLHELSHAIAGVLTGGKVVEIQVHANQGGHCLIAGGSRVISLAAGYLGSLLWGGLIMLGASRGRYDRLLSASIGVLTVAVTLFYVRNLFGLLFGIIFGVGLMALAKFASERINDLCLRAIGFTSCLYAVLDIKSDILDRPGVRSDARMLSEVTYIPTVVWGIVWITCALVLSVYFLVLCSEATRRKSNPKVYDPLGLRK